MQQTSQARSWTTWERSQGGQCSSGQLRLVYRDLHNHHFLESRQHHLDPYTIKFSGVWNSSRRLRQGYLDIGNKQCRYSGFQRHVRRFVCEYRSFFDG